MLIHPAGWFVRLLYFTILITHVTLAAASCADGHRDAVAGPRRAIRSTGKIARWTFPDLAVRVSDRRSRLRAAVSSTTWIS